MTNMINRIAFIVWRFFAFLFFGISVWFFFGVLLTGTYAPTFKMSDPPKVWEVLWDLRGVVVLPAIYMLPGLLFWWFGSLFKRKLQSQRNEVGVVSK